MTIKNNNSFSLEKIVVNNVEYTRKEILNQILESGIL